MAAGIICSSVEFGPGPKSSMLAVPYAIGGGPDIGLHPFYDRLNPMVDRPARPWQHDACT